MSSTGHALSIDPVTDKDGVRAWQVVTDYATKDADGKTRSGIWLPRPGPKPDVGDEVSWGHSLFGGTWAMWGGEKYIRLAYAFDPNSPDLFTG